MNRVLVFKKIAKYFAKLGLGRSKTMVNIYEETFSRINSGIREEYVEIDGQKVFLDKEDSLLLSTRKDNYDKFEINYLKQIIKEGDIIIDLGANIGYYTLIFAKLVGDLGHVYAFEPEPSNFELLSKNIKENNHSNVTLIQKAVSNKNSKIKLYVSKRNLASHRIFDSDEKRNSVEVDVITLDEYFKKFEKPIKFIKIDVEGAEGAVLLGTSKIIEKSENLTIMMEYFPKWIKKFGDEPKEILKSLLQKDFKLYNLNQKNNRLDTIQIEKFVSEYNEEKKNYTNILCVKNKTISS